MTDETLGLVIVAIPFLVAAGAIWLLKDGKQNNFEYQDTFEDRNGMTFANVDGTAMSPHGDFDVSGKPYGSRGLWSD